MSDVHDDPVEKIRTEGDSVLGMPVGMKPADAVRIAMRRDRLLAGLTLTAGTIHNRRLRVASDDIVDAIRGGGSLSAAMRRAGVFPPLLTYLAASGEAAGRLDEMLERAADYLEREFDRFTATALSLLEPAIIVVMGGVVATIVLSILLPILQLNTLAGQ